MFPKWGWRELPGLNAQTLVFILGFFTGTTLVAFAEFFGKVLVDLVSTRASNIKQKCVKRLHSSDKELNHTLEKLNKSLEIGRTMLHQLVRVFLKDLERELETEGTSLRCIPTHITKIPTGNETGTYLVFVLGGSNYRIAFVELLGKGRSRTFQAKSELPEYIKTSNSDVLFDFCADRILRFYQQIGLSKSTPVKMGFTFSFPLDHKSVNSGHLIIWTKGFSVDGVVGKCVVELFKKSIDKINLEIEITAVVNDAVSTLLSSIYSDDSTSLGVILGTGNNAAYVEDIANIHKLKNYSTNDTKMIINIEWGGWGSGETILPATIYDVKVDRVSYNPRTQNYEKMISGMYLGEVARYILLDLISTGELFHGATPQLLKEPYSFTIIHMSRIERDYSSDLGITKNLLEEFYQIDSATFEDLKIVRKVCEMVSTRAARMSAVGISAALMKLKKVGEEGTTVAMNGSVVEFYPHFQNKIRDTFRELFGVVEEEILLTESPSGPIVGAAIAAAMYGPRGENLSIDLNFKET